MERRDLQDALDRIGSHAFSLSAIGAALSLKLSGVTAPSEVRRRLEDCVTAALGDTLEDLDAQAAREALDTVTIYLEEALELLRNPAREAAWVIHEADMLQAQGQASRQNVGAFLALAQDRPQLAQALRGRFLDVGTGVAGIALEAAERCPDLRVVGIDIWEPSLALARRNVAESRFVDRVEIRQQDVTQLAEEATFSLVWLPAPFLPRSVLELALDAVFRVLAPGGHLIVGFTEEQPDRLANAHAALRMVRSGGQIWDRFVLEDRLRAHGFRDVEVPEPPYADFMIGRRP